MLTSLFRQSIRSLTSSSSRQTISPSKVIVRGMGSVHDIAKSGFGVGTNDLYDRARPTYPASALSYIHSTIPTSSHERGLRIIEPGSGTGIFSRLLISPPPPGASADGEDYPQWNISRLSAVEPSEGMRAQWDKGTAKLSPQALEGREIKTVAGGFDDLSQAGIKEGEADLVVIAQAWHWCPDHEKAFREIAKYLAPGGVLVFIWNLESGTSPIPKRLRALYEPLDKGSPQYYRGLWRKGFETKAFKEEFGEEGKEEKVFDWNTGITDQGIIDRIFSKSYMTEAHLNGKQKEKVEREFREILADSENVKEYIDSEKGIWRFDYSTDVISMRKK